MKTPATRIKELRVNLWYHQMNARLEARWLGKSRAKCMEIAAEMRLLQREIPPRKKRTKG